MSDALSLRDMQKQEDKRRIHKMLLKWTLIGIGTMSGPEVIKKIAGF
jgi:hypothetical protein